MQFVLITGHVLINTVTKNKRTLSSCPQTFTINLFRSTYNCYLFFLFLIIINKQKIDKKFKHLLYTTYKSIIIISNTQHKT